MTKTILLPTDFSENSWLAIQYAARHAKAINADLKIVHIFQSFYSAFASEKFNEEILDHTTDVANKQMDTLLEKLRSSFASISVTGECIKGVMHITIPQLLKKHNYDLIIMGTRGASGIKRIIGSNTLDVINLSSVPVLAVPEDASAEVNKIGLLTNFKEEEIDVLQKALDILPPSDTVALLHIREGNYEAEEMMLEKWTRIFQEKLSIANIGHRIGSGEDIPATIDDMIQKEKANILVVTNNGKSFFRTLLNRNLVRSIALSPQIPILFIRSK